MKNIFAIILIAGAFDSIQGQELPKFDLTKDGVNPIIIQVDSMDAEKIYQKTIKWIQESYKDPQQVLKANIENEKIRIEAFKSNAWYYMSLGTKYLYDMDYTFEIEFKDRKIRLTYTPGQFWAQGKRGLTYESFYKSAGEIRPAYKESEISLEQTMNELRDSLYNYLTKKNKSNDW